MYAADAVGALGPADTVAALRASIESLVGDGSLAPARARPLLQRLDAAAARLSDGFAPAAARRVELIQARATRAGIYDTRLGGDIAGLLDSLALQLDPAQLMDVADVVYCGDPPPDSAYSPLYVRAGAKASLATGSMWRPFPTIAAALRWADEKHLAAAKIDVGAGSWGVDFTTTRATWIRGASRATTKLYGAITLSAGGVLRLERLSMFAARAQVRPAIFAAGPCPNLSLADVKFSGCRAACVEQTGGHLAAVNVTCESLRAAGGRAAAFRLKDVDTTLSAVTIHDSDGGGLRAEGGTVSTSLLMVDSCRWSGDGPEAGRAIVLTGGVKAALVGTILDDNAAGALLVEGPETRALAGLFVARRNFMSPAITAEIQGAGSIVDGMGAVEVRDSALLLMQLARLEENAYIGLLVHRGGRAHFRSGTVLRTRHGASVYDPEWGIVLLGGHNVAASHTAIGDAPRAEVELNDFELLDADFAGISVWGAGASLRNGDVGGNAIGAVLRNGVDDFRPGTADVSGLTVRYYNNGINMDADAMLVIPGPDQSPDGPFCSGVPWVCDWCAYGSP